MPWQQSFHVWPRGTFLHKLIHLPDKCGLLPTPKETYDLNLSIVLWSFGHFESEYRFLVPKNCTILVFLHSFCSARIPDGMEKYWRRSTKDLLKNHIAWINLVLNKISIGLYVCADVCRKVTFIPAWLKWPSRASLSLSFSGLKDPT